MSHLEVRQEKDLDQIRACMIGQADAATVAVENAVRAVQQNNTKLAYDVVLGDHAINRMTREIERLCHRFIAVHLPSAGPLRLLSSVIRANVELERMGDYAVTIARETAQMSGAPQGILSRELDRVAGETLLMLRQSVKAFKELNADLAKGTMGIADQLEHNMDMVYAELVANTDKDQVKDNLAIFVIFNQLKRVSDLSKNLCEHTVFAVTGEQKKPKIHKIMFLDRHNSRTGPMAKAIAEHSFPNSGRYATAGLSPAAALDAELVQFLEGRGIDTQALSPKAFSDLTLGELTEQHLLVCLDCPIGEFITDMPFHTSVVQWELGDGTDMNNLYRELAARISDLLELLWGEGAD